MRRYALALVVAAVLAGVVWSVWRRPVEWTVADPQALAELRRGIDALEKFYSADAKERFQRVLEIDPSCVVARVFLLEAMAGTEPAAARAAVLDELEKADLAKLTARERFMASYVLAAAKGRRQDADAILDGYLADHPNDAVAVRYAANRAFAAGRLEEAQRQYERLLTLSPNYAVAYNQLGYTAMGRGQFAEAEKLLRKYRFIAPDQANPHDSLGELLLLRGRYQEAEREFEQALAAKEDFCASYGGLILLGQVSGQLEVSERALERAAAVSNCAEAVLPRGRLSVARWRAATRGDWPQLVALAGEGKSSEVGSCPSVLTHRALLLLGRVEDAVALERSLGEGEKASTRPNMAVLTPCTLHMEGVRLAQQGQRAEAVAKFAACDAALAYQGAYPGVFKLYNLVHLARELQRAGESERAASVAATVRGVNPSFANELLRALSVSY